MLMSNVVYVRRHDCQLNAKQSIVNLRVILLFWYINLASHYLQSGVVSNEN